MNILPQYKKDEVNKGYKMRIVVTSFWATFFTLIVCSGLILPAYIIASSKLDEINERKKMNSKTLKEQTDIVNAPLLINQKALLVMQNVRLVSVANRIIKITEVPNKGVVINKISHKKTKITVSGRAPNRDSLLSFKKEIDRIDFVKNTLVPVGDFAKDKNLIFTMTINIEGE